MAIEGKDYDAMYNLGCHYFDCKHFENMMKYFEIAINAGHDLDKIMLKINEYLDELERDNFEKLLLCKKYLDAKNLKKLNDHLKMYYYYKSFEKNIIDTINECDICFEELHSLHLICKHKICYNCYGQIEKCPFCRTNI